MIADLPTARSPEDQDSTDFIKSAAQLLASRTGCGWRLIPEMPTADEDNLVIAINDTYGNLVPVSVGYLMNGFGGGMSDDEWTPPAKIFAPWTDDQVRQLAAYQACEHFHPYTCGVDSRHGSLVPTALGWRCDSCGYRQNWAHEGSLTIHLGGRTFSFFGGALDTANPEE